MNYKPEHRSEAIGIDSVREALVSNEAVPILDGNPDPLGLADLVSAVLGLAEEGDSFFDALHIIRDQIAVSVAKSLSPMFGPANSLSCLWIIIIPPPHNIRWAP
jgi:hypothetical protein